MKLFHKIGILGYNIHILYNMRNRSIKRKRNTRARRTRRHRGGYFGVDPVAAPVVEPVAAPVAPAVAPEECGWWGRMWGCPKPIVGGRKKNRKISRSKN
jgi:hypothetical protein